MTEGMECGRSNAGDGTQSGGEGSSSGVMKKGRRAGGDEDEK